MLFIQHFSLQFQLISSILLTLLKLMDILWLKLLQLLLAHRLNLFL